MRDKLHIVYRKTGEIVAASMTNNPPIPIGEDDLTTGEYEIPAEHRTKKMYEYIHLLSVDTTQGYLVERKDSAT